MGFEELDTGELELAINHDNQTYLAKTKYVPAVPTRFSEARNKLPFLEMMRTEWYCLLLQIKGKTLDVLLFDF